MLSYQHGYHAGNFADVIKHLALSRLLQYLIKKDKPAFYLETHAARGSYDLFDAQANKTTEYQQGIALLWQQRHQLPSVFDNYLNSIIQRNPDNVLRFYPGSPAIAIDLLRHQDQLVCCELHPREFDYLEQLPRQGKRVSFLHDNGIHQLKAQLPPKQRRGLVFIDPAYEVKTEYKKIPMAIKAAYTHFSGGVFCLWYPLIDKYLNEQLLRQLELIPAINKLKIEFYLPKSDDKNLMGCGLWLINPPYVFADEMNEALRYLCKLIKGASFVITE